MVSGSAQARLVGEPMEKFGDGFSLIWRKGEKKKKCEEIDWRERENISTLIIKKGKKFMRQLVFFFFFRSTLGGGIGDWEGG